MKTAEQKNGRPKIFAAFALSIPFFWPAVSFGRPPLTSADRQFDLVCDLHGHVVSDPHPVSHGTYPANVTSWHDKFRFAVDLEALRYCDPVGCARPGPQRIKRVTAKEIVFEDEPGDKWIIYRRNLHSFDLLEDLGSVDVTTGRCHRAIFSGLSWHFEKDGRVVQGAGPRGQTK